MKRLTFLMLFLTAALGLAKLPAVFTQEARSWNFIQAVGGMKISAEDKQLFVDCNVSGTKTITVKPTLVNSGIGVRKVKVRRDGNKLMLTVVTSVIGKDVGPVPKPVDLSSLPDGRYQVVYLDPKGKETALGKISLELLEKGEK